MTKHKKHGIKIIIKKSMKNRSLLYKNISHWAIFLFASLAVATSIADVWAKNSIDILMLHPELAESSILVTVGYLPTF